MPLDRVEYALAAIDFVATDGRVDCWFILPGLLKYNIKNCISKVIVMPISLRVPTDIEAQIAGYGSRTGLTKSAVIVRSIQEFLARHAAPSSLQIYEEVMQQADDESQFDLPVEGLAQRSVKLQVCQAIQSKHAERSERATRALAKKRSSATKLP